MHFGRFTLNYYTSWLMLYSSPSLSASKMSWLTHVSTKMFIRYFSGLIRKKSWHSDQKNMYLIRQCCLKVPCSLQIGSWWRDERVIEKETTQSERRTLRQQSNIFANIEHIVLPRRQSSRCFGLADDHGPLNFSHNAEIHWKSVIQKTWSYKLWCSLWWANETQR